MGLQKNLQEVTGRCQLLMTERENMVMNLTNAGEQLGLNKPLEEFLEEEWSSSMLFRPHFQPFHYRDW